jgi:hypothetical protein
MPGAPHDGRRARRKAKHCIKNKRPAAPHSSQEQLAALVVHSRALIAAVELGERWPPRELARRCDEVLGGGGTLLRLWPLVDAERQAARDVLSGVKLADLRAVVLRLAVLTGTDLSALSVADADGDGRSAPMDAAGGEAGSGASG